MPSTRQAIDSGRLMANVARQPPSSISRPPSVGPITMVVWVAMLSALSTPAGLRTPVRRPSLRIRCMLAG